MSIEKLEKKGAIQILLFLLSRDDHAANRTALKEGISIAPETIFGALKRLIELHLIYETVTGIVPQETTTFLTEKGILVAKQLAKVKELLQEHA